MTAVDVDALDKLREAATAGPWRVPYPFTKLVDVPGREASITSESVADAALIVAAVNALPDLLAEVRRGRALREAANGVMVRCNNARAFHAATGESDEAQAYDNAGEWIRRALAATDGTP